MQAKHITIITIIDDRTWYLEGAQLSFSYPYFSNTL
jgi:hypothetical protein